MNKALKTILLAAVGTAVVATVKAESYGDLIVGFTTQNGTDHMYDLGRLDSFTSGKTWSAATLGISGGTYNFGVIGDAYAADYASNGGFITSLSGTNDTLWSTTSGAVPGKANQSVFGQTDTGISAVLNNFPGGQANTNPGDHGAIVATDDNSWNTQTLNGTKPSNFVNAYGNPNAVNQAPATLWQVADNGVAAPVAMGQFTLSTGGVLTYTAASTVAAPVAGFTGTPVAGFAPLKVVLSDTSTGNITNWLWTFGDGHTYTNTVSSNATNTYTTVGTYTVSLKVTGPGGNTTTTKTAFVVVSPVPSFAKVILNGNNLILSGTNGPAGVQYRILNSTNLATPLANWLPVYTNTFSASGTFSFTNATTKPQSYFKLVSP